MSKENPDRYELGKAFWMERANNLGRQLFGLRPNSFEWVELKEQQEEAQLRLHQLTRRQSIIRILGSHLIKKS